MKNNDVVKNLVVFQKTGRGFDDVWAAIRPVVHDFAGRSLRKLSVKSACGVDAWAVDDVVSQTVEKLLGLAAPRAGGRFDPAKARNPGMAGVRAWLWRIVEREAVNWTRNYRAARGLKISAETSLAWNEPEADADATILKQLEAKVYRADLLPILEECIGLLADPEHRQLVNLKLFDGLSIRDTADKLVMSPATVQRRLKDAFDLLRPLLASRGVDEAWLAA
ncbi:MAG: RNA polymerase sigma factor [Planctomycetia bacterium]